MSERKLAMPATAEQWRHEHRHHTLSLSEIPSHVAIAITTIAIITRQKWPGARPIALGLAVGVVAAIAHA